MALAAVAYAKAMRGRRIMIATTSVGPGSTNLVTAAAAAHANRLPVLLLSGDTFQHRIVDPVLQQVEHFDDPTITVADAFKPVTRYWDRITRPEQIVRSLPQALAVMLDPATRGPAFLALPQDIQAEAYDYPAAFFEPKVHYIRRPGPDPRDVAAAATLLARCAAAAASSPAAASTTRAPSTWSEPSPRSIGSRSSRRSPARRRSSHDHPNYAGPIGVTGSKAANAVAGRADVVLAVGTRLQDFTTGSWALFKEPNVRFVSVNTASWDAHKQAPNRSSATPRSRIEALDAALGASIGYDRLAVLRPGADRRRGIATSTRGRAAPRRPPGLRGGDPGHQRALRRRRLLPVCGGRPTRRTGHGLALEVGRFVRFRVRLLDDGLRDRRRLGRQDGTRRGRRHRLGRRRLVPDDELGHLLDRDDRSQGDLHRLRQRRLRGHQPSPGQLGRRRIQQPARHDPPRAVPRRSTS